MAKRTGPGIRMGILTGALLIWLLGGTVALSSGETTPLAGSDAYVGSDLSCWGSVANISLSLTKSRAPSMDSTSDGKLHIVWEEGRYLYHSHWNGVAWSYPWRITVGEQPALVIDHNDIPHLIFVNEFRGNYEIYYSQWTGTTWTLPRNVSSTSGVSAIPDIAVDSLNTLHVVWADNSPGYSVIYYGRWTGTFWINSPIPHARGSVPSIAIGGDDLLHVVWQDRDSIDDFYEIYHTQRDISAWSLPENLSDSERQSTIPDVQVGPDLTTHVVWEELVDSQELVYYCGGQSFLWSTQESVSSQGATAYLPSLAIDEQGYVHAAWDAAEYLAYRWHLGLVAPWASTRCIAENSAGIADVALASGPDGALHAAWAERVDDANWDIYYGRQQSVYADSIVLPLLLR